MVVLHIQRVMGYNWVSVLIEFYILQLINIQLNCNMVDAAKTVSTASTSKQQV